MKNKLYIALVLVCSLYSTPSEWHIQEKGWEALLEDVKNDNKYEIGFDCKTEVHYDEGLLSTIQLHTPLIWEIIEHEKEAGFFGYHAADYSVKIYQEILRAVFADLLKVKVPSDFHFFRIPTDLLVTREGGAKEFFQEIQSQSRFESEKLAVHYFLLLPLNETLNLSLTLDDFNEKELHILSSALMQNFKIFLPTYIYFKEGIEYKAEPFTPTFKSYQKDEILPCLQKKYPETSFSEALDKILSPESFVRQWGTYSGDSITFFFSPFNNFKEDQRPLLLSLNYSLLGNANNSTSFTLGYFLEPFQGEDFSRLINFLTPFFEGIGLNPAALNEIFSAADEKLQSQHWGCLYQFFDKSPDFEDLDIYGYVSFSGGVPFTTLTPSDVVKGIVPLYATKDEEDEYLQLRLVMTKNGVLNPQGSFRMRFYDLLDPEVSLALNQMIHRKVQGAVVDPAKLKKYQAQVQKLWNN